jgi:serine protease Do
MTLWDLPCPQQTSPRRSLLLWFQVLCHGREPPVAANLHAPVRTPPQPTIVPERVFQSLDNHDAVGFDYQTLKNVSRAECQSRCQSDNSCKALTYNKPERFCFLKTGAVLLVANRDAATAVAGELAPSVVVSTFTIAAGRDMAGGDYLRLRNSNFVACYVACEQDSQCRAFAFVRKQKTCWLKNSIGLLSAKAGVDLGIR